MRFISADNPLDPNEVINYIYAFKELGVDDVLCKRDINRLLR